MIRCTCPGSSRPAPSWAGARSNAPAGVGTLSIAGLPPGAAEPQKPKSGSAIPSGGHCGQRVSPPVAKRRRVCRNWSWRVEGGGWRGARGRHGPCSLRACRVLSPGMPHTFSKHAAYFLKACGMLSQNMPHVFSKHAACFLQACRILSQDMPHGFSRHAAWFLQACPTLGPGPAHACPNRSRALEGPGAFHLMGTWPVRPQTPPLSPFGSAHSGQASPARGGEPAYEPGSPLPRRKGGRGAGSERRRDTTAGALLDSLPPFRYTVGQPRHARGKKSARGAVRPFLTQHSTASAIRPIPLLAEDDGDSACRPLMV